MSLVGSQLHIILQNSTLIKCISYSYSLMHVIIILLISAGSVWNTNISDTYFKYLNVFCIWNTFWSVCVAFFKYLFYLYIGIVFSANHIWQNNTCLLKIIICNEMTAKVINQSYWTDETCQITMNFNAFVMFVS